MPNIELIQCGDHKWAPWSIVCTHLCTGQSREWVPVESSFKEVDYDWVCPECDAIMQAGGEPPLEVLHVVCIHCVRALRARLDPKFQE